MDLVAKANAAALASVEYEWPFRQDQCFVRVCNHQFQGTILLMVGFTSRVKQLFHLTRLYFEADGHLTFWGDEMPRWS